MENWVCVLNMKSVYKQLEGVEMVIIQYVWRWVMVMGQEKAVCFLGGWKGELQDQSHGEIVNPRSSPAEIKTYGSLWDLLLWPSLRALRQCVTTGMYLGKFHNTVSAVTRLEKKGDIFQFWSDQTKEPTRSLAGEWVGQGVSKSWSCRV